MRTLLASAWIPCLVGKLTRHALLEGATNARHRRGRHCQGVKHHGSDARRSWAFGTIGAVPRSGSPLPECKVTST